MKIIRNPSAFNLMCDAADKEIRAGKEIIVPDDVAVRVSTLVFVVDDYDPGEDDKPKKAPATRKTEVRGSDEVEVTKAPECETR